MTALLIVGIVLGTLLLYLAFVIFGPIKQPRQPLSELASGPVPLAPETLEGRRDVLFSVEGEEVVGWLYMPSEPTGPVPCVILNNGFGGTRKMVLEPFARRFAEAGLAALTFDYRHFGDSAGEPRHLFSLDGQVADCRGAIAFARGLPEIDADRIAIWGTSATRGCPTGWGSPSAGRSGIGTDFAKPKAPLIWYDVVHYLDTLTRFPTARNDKRLGEVAKLLRSKLDDEGRVTSASVWARWKGWEFCQKREPSFWLTFLCHRALARLKPGT
jgi:hypothetical protein